MRYISILLCVLLTGCTIPAPQVDPESLIAIEAALADISVDDTILSEDQPPKREEAKPKLNPGVPSITLDQPAEPVSETSSSPYVLRGKRRGFFSKRNKHLPQPSYNLPPPLR